VIPMNDPPEDQPPQPPQVTIFDVRRDIEDEIAGRSALREILATLDRMLWFAWSNPLPGYEPPPPNAPSKRQHVFDAEASATARDAAIEQVKEAADMAWKVEAFAAVDYVSRLKDEFTTDAVWWKLAQRGIGFPREPRAMGAIMRKAVLAGLCEPTDQTRKSVRVDCHRRPLQVWKSKVKGIR